MKLDNAAPVTAKTTKNPRRSRPQTAELEPAVEIPAAPKRSALVSLLILFLLMASTLGVFQYARTEEFVNWDDNINIYANKHLNPVTAQSIPSFWLHYYEYTYRPMIYTLWALIAAAAHVPAHAAASGIGTISLNPHAFHIANLLLHSINTALVFLVLRLLVRNLWAAGAGALLFGIHPTQAEPVAWITGMNELLFGFFALLALWSYLSFAIASRENREVNRRRVHYALGLLFYVLAMLTKPTAVVLPVIALVLDYCVVRRPLQQCAFGLSTWAVLIVPGVLVAMAAKPPEITAVHTAIWSRPFVAGDALAFYLWKLALPFPLCPDYGRTPDFVMRHWWGYALWLIPCALAYLLWRPRTSRPMLGVSGALFVIGLLPVLGFIPNSFQLFSTVADRYLYLSLLGPALGLSWLLDHSSGTRAARVLWTFSVIVFAALATASAVQTTYWKSPQALYAHTMVVNPKSWMAYNNLGTLLLEQGKQDAAAAAFRTALEIRPAFAQAQTSLGDALRKQGKTEEAIAAYHAALQIDPNSADAQHNLALALANQGKPEDAIAAYRAALLLNPQSSDTHHNLAVLLSKQGDFDEAIAEYRETIRLKPDFAEAHYNLANALRSRGRHEEAIPEFREALRLHDDAAPVHNNLGFSLAHQGHLEDAIGEWKEAIRLQPDYIEAHYNLGIALNLQGKPDEAMAQFREALRIKPNYSQAQSALAKIVGAHGGKP